MVNLNEYALSFSSIKPALWAPSGGPGLFPEALQRPLYAPISQQGTVFRLNQKKVRKNATIDWAMKESARAKLMVIVRRTLNKYGYPPDKQQKAVDTVLKQAEVLADYWVEQ